MMSNPKKDEPEEIQVDLEEDVPTQRMAPDYHAKLEAQSYSELESPITKRMYPSQ